MLLSRLEIQDTNMFFQKIYFLSRFSEQAVHI